MGSTYGRLEERGPLIANAGFVELCIEFKDLNESLPPPLNVLLIPYDLYELGLYWWKLCTNWRQQLLSSEHASEAGGDRKTVRM